MTPHLAALQEGVPGNRGVVWEIGWSPRTLRAHVSRLSLVMFEVWMFVGQKQYREISMS